MKTTLDVMIVPVGGEPYMKALEADGRGSFLPALQECVGGLIAPMGYVFGDAPAVYCNDEGKLAGSGCAPNRAVYADEDMAAAGYASPSDPSRAVKPGELFDIAFGDLVCVGLDPATGESRDISTEERGRVAGRFGGRESIESGGLEAARIRLAAIFR